MAIALPAAASLLESYDLFFSIATGRWIIAHGFPSRDPFSLTATELWSHHEWAYCVLSAWSAELFGGWGPSLLAALVLAIEVLLVGALLREAQGERYLLGLVCLLLVFGAQDYAWNAERAYHLGHLAFVLAVLLVQRYRRGGRIAAWLFIPLVAVWANLHGSWVAGPALLGALALGQAADGVVEGPVRLRRFGEAVLVCALALLASALSPDTWRMPLYPLRFLTGFADYEVAEWHPLSLGNTCGASLAALAGLALWAAARARRRCFALLLPALGLTLVATRIERFSPMAAVLLAVAALEHLQSGPALGWPAHLGHAWRRLDAWLRPAWLRAGGGIWVLAAIAVLACLAGAEPASLESRMDRRFFPVRALRVLSELPPGKVLNTYRFGGAISALAGPDYKVYIDGRAEPFPPEVHADYRRMALLLPGWREAFERYAPDYLLWSRELYGSALIEVLEGAGWRALVEERAGGLWLPPPRD